MDIVIVVLVMMDHLVMEMVLAEVLVIGQTLKI